MAPPTPPLKLPHLHIFDYRIDLHDLINLQHELGNTHVSEVKDANIILCNTNAWRKARTYLRISLAEKGLTTKSLYPLQAKQEEEEDEEEDKEHGAREHGVEPEVQEHMPSSRPNKKRKIDVDFKGKEIINLDSSTESEDEHVHKSLHYRKPLTPDRSSPPIPNCSQDVAGPHVYSVFKLDWYRDSLKVGSLLDTAKYLVYRGVEVEKKMEPRVQPTILPPARPVRTIPSPDTPPCEQSFSRGRRARQSGTSGSQRMTKRPHLVPQSTSGKQEKYIFIPSILFARIFAQIITLKNDLLIL